MYSVLHDDCVIVLLTLFSTPEFIHLLFLCNPLSMKTFIFTDMRIQCHLLCILLLTRLHGGKCHQLIQLMTVTGSNCGGYFYLECTIFASWMFKEIWANFAD